MSRRFPAKDRPGKQAWLGPVSLGLGVLSFVAFTAAPIVAFVAVACGATSMMTRTEYRIDWTAVVGTAAGAVTLLISLMLFTMSVSGH